MGGVGAIPKVWNPDKFAGAIEAGSKEGFDIKVKSIWGEMGDKKDDVHHKNGQKLDKNNNLLQQILGKMSDFQGIEGI